MRIGTFCSGGDAPGMNACVRAVVRSAICHGHEVVGIRHGWQGLLDEDFHRQRDGTPLMSPRCVSNILQRGGTILYSSRSEAFRTEPGQRRAAENLRKNQIDALVPIGGDGTFRGAMVLAQYWDGRIVGCPGTIDNDLCGTDATIGFSTAVNTAVEAIDKLRDTAESHERMFLVEVMGRHCGYIALYSALAGGAEGVCVRETPTDLACIVQHLDALKRRGKHSIIVIVAEGDEAGGAETLNRQLQEQHVPFETRAVTLGHLQRGGVPTPDDRILATRLGDFAVRSILAGHTGCTAGIRGGQLALTPFDQAVAGHPELPAELLQLLETMSI